MGQAKRRGTFEERQALAQARNTEIEKARHKMHPDLQKFANKYGIQRLASRLTAAGRMGHPVLVATPPLTSAGVVAAMANRPESPVIVLDPPTEAGTANEETERTDGTDGAAAPQS